MFQCVWRLVGPQSYLFTPVKGRPPAAETISHMQHPVPAVAAQERQKTNKNHTRTCVRLQSYGRGKARTRPVGRPRRPQPTPSPPPNVRRRHSECRSRPSAQPPPAAVANPASLAPFVRSPCIVHHHSPPSTPSPPPHPPAPTSPSSSPSCSRLLGLPYSALLEKYAGPSWRCRVDVVVLQRHERPVGVDGRW